MADITGRDGLNNYSCQQCGKVIYAGQSHSCGAMKDQAGLDERALRQALEHARPYIVDISARVVEYPGKRDEADAALDVLHLIDGALSGQQPADVAGTLRDGETALVVKSAPLGCSYTHEYEHCPHLFEEDGDFDLGGNRYEVKCRLCGCPGEFYQDQESVTWPTT